MTPRQFVYDCIVADQRRNAVVLVRQSYQPFDSGVLMAPCELTEEIRDLAVCTSWEAMRAAMRLLDGAAEADGAVRLTYAGNVHKDLRPEHLRNGEMIPL